MSCIYRIIVSKMYKLKKNVNTQKHKNKKDIWIEVKRRNKETKKQTKNKL